MYTTYIQNFKTLASFCSWAGRFESCLIANLEDRFSRDVAHIIHVLCKINLANKPPHDKTNKMTVRPAKTQISRGIRPLWSESSLCAQWVAKDPSFLHADSEDSDQTGQMPRLLRLAHSHVVGFVMMRFKCFCMRQTHHIRLSLSVYCICIASRYKRRQREGIPGKN